MFRKIIQIEEDRCTGCGACAAACHEGAIGMVNGKAKLLREDYCDGLGDCLPACPADAITFTMREAAAYDEAAVLQAKKKRQAEPPACACPGSQASAIRPAADGLPDESRPSQLRQWPVQIKLAAPNAPYFAGADLLVAADCTAYAYAGFHERFIRGRITLVGCPKLDNVNYAEKLTQILQLHEIRSITAVRMEVPCCGGLIHAVRAAIERSGMRAQLRVATISTDGRIVSEVIV